MGAQGGELASSTGMHPGPLQQLLRSCCAERHADGAPLVFSVLCSGFWGFWG